MRHGIRRASAMRFGLAVLASLAALGGCGSDDDGDQQSASRAASALSERLEAWRGAVLTYNADLQRCGGQPNPEERVIPYCTRKSRREYRRAAQRLRAELKSTTGSSGACRHAKLDGTTLERAMTAVLARTYAASRDVERSASTDDPYRGPPVPEALEATDEATSRTAEISQRLVDPARSCGA